MVEGNLSDIIRTSLDGIRELTESETFVGAPIETASGVTVIPVSKITLGFATGGVDLAARKVTGVQNFGGGGGSGVSITPIAFITVSPSGTVDMIDFSKESVDFSDKICYNNEVVLRERRLFAEDFAQNTVRTYFSGCSADGSAPGLGACRHFPAVSFLKR